VPSPQIPRRILLCICRAKVQSKGTQSRSFTGPKRQAQADLEEDYTRSVSFRLLAKTFLAAHAEDFTTSLFRLNPLRFETMEHGGEQATS
jgi:hypothetical protein